jgi:hypothetical protein
MEREHVKRDATVIEWLALGGLFGLLASDRSDRSCDNDIGIKWKKSEGEIAWERDLKFREDRWNAMSSQERLDAKQETKRLESLDKLRRNQEQYANAHTLREQL